MSDGVDKHLLWLYVMGNEVLNIGGQTDSNLYKKINKIMANETCLNDGCNTYVTPNCGEVSTESQGRIKNRYCIILWTIEAVE